MKAYIAELPLRTIHLKLQDKAPTSLESSGLTLYLNLHQELWEVKQAVEQYRTSVEELQAIVKNLGAAYNALEAEAKKYGKMAGFNGEEENYPFAKENKVWHTLDRRHLQQLADNYSNLVAKYMDQRHSPEKIYDIAKKKLERFDESFNHFDRNYFSQMLHAYDVLQIDTCSLDDDFDKFRETCSEIDDLFYFLLDEWEIMCETVKEIDHNIKQLNQHLKCLSDTLALKSSGNQNPNLN